MTKGVDNGAYLDINLVGTPDQVCEKVAALAARGASSDRAACGQHLEEMRGRSACSPDVVSAFPEPAIASVREAS